MDAQSDEGTRGGQAAEGLELLSPVLCPGCPPSLLKSLCTYPTMLKQLHLGDPELVQICISPADLIVSCYPNPLPNHCSSRIYSAEQARSLGESQDPSAWLSPPHPITPWRPLLDMSPVPTSPPLSQPSHCHSLPSFWNRILVLLLAPLWIAFIAIRVMTSKY